VKLRLQFTEEFIAYQNRHTRWLQRFQKDQFLSFKELMNRHIPEFEELAARAGHAGKEGKFAEAQELHDAGVEARNRELDRRAAVFEEGHCAKVNKILDEQRQELQTLTDRMTRDVEGIDVQRREKMKMMKGELKYRLNRAFTEARGRTRVRKKDQRILPASDGSSVVSSSTSVCSAKMSPVYVRELTRRYEEILSKFRLAGEVARPIPMSPAAGSVTSRVSSQAPSVTSAFPSQGI
jgi:hypothetical protein